MFVAKEYLTYPITIKTKKGYIELNNMTFKNLKETIALDLLSTILGDGKSSRLYKNLVESQDEPYYYQIESCHYQFKDGDNFFIEANFNADKKDIVENELKEYFKL